MGVSLLLADTRDNVAGVATLLEFDSYEQHTNNDVIAFSKPFFNGIFVMDSGLVSSGVSPIYYGDKMTMRGWDFLKMPLGTIKDSEEVLTHQDGWRYIYNHKKRTFDAIDNLGNTYIHRDNIQTIGDLHIDFTIQMSHDFEVIIGSLDASDFDFYRLGKRRDITFGPSPVVVGQKCYDNLYGYNDVPSFSNHLATDKRIDEIDDNYAGIGIIPTTRSVDVLESPISVGHREFGNDATQETKVYDDSFKVFDLNFIKPEYRAQALKWNFLLPMMSRCIYPELYGVEGFGETHNNRPVYEPWLIWGVFKFLFLHRDDAGDDGRPPIEIFDLAPNWSY